MRKWKPWTNMENNKKTTSTAIEVANENDKAIVAQLPMNVQEFNPTKQVENARIAAQALMSVISQKKKPVQFNGEQYLEFEDWQTVAQFYNHTVGTEWTKEVRQKDEIYGYEAKANLYDRNGLVVGGAEAGCFKDEPNWKSKPLFQLRSMAQTRAMAKALRSKFGFVAVLAGFKPTPAEEMGGVVSQPTPKQGTTAKLATEFFCSEHDQRIGLVPAGISKKTGKPYKAFYICSTGGCKAPILNSDGVRVRQHPETGEMIPDQVEEVEVVESSMDKARRILDAKVPRGDYPL